MPEQVKFNKQEYIHLAQLAGEIQDYLQEECDYEAERKIMKFYGFKHTNEDIESELFDRLEHVSEFLSESDKAEIESYSDKD